MLITAKQQIHKLGAALARATAGEESSPAEDKAATRAQELRDEFFYVEQALQQVSDETKRWFDRTNPKLGGVKISAQEHRLKVSLGQAFGLAGLSGLADWLLSGSVGPEVNGMSYRTDQGEEYRFTAWMDQQDGYYIKKPGQDGTRLIKATPLEDSELFLKETLSEKNGVLNYHSEQVVLPPQAAANPIRFFEHG